MKKFSDLAGFRRPLGCWGVGGTRRALPQQVAARGGDVLGQVAEDDVAGLGGAGHGALHQLEVGLVRHLPAVLVQLAEVLGVELGQPLARHVRLAAAQLREVPLLVNTTLGTY